jgi:large subunit ribosomal protein L6
LYGKEVRELAELEIKLSRIGRKPINIPAGVDVKFDNGVLTVKGPKGTLTQKIHPNMIVEIAADVVEIKVPDDKSPKAIKQNRALHGLTRSLVANMVTGVTEGYQKKLELKGVGYRVQKKGKELVMNLGYSHQVIFTDTADVTIEAPDANTIIVSGADKQKVGQMAAEIREKRPPEPYKGKGIKYADEVIRRKEGKAGKGKK